jgi:predicted nucleic acid-binding protein
LVIIDTSVWIAAYGKKPSPMKAEVHRLVESGQAAITGLIMAEILRGARSEQEFDQMTEELLAAEYLEDNYEIWLSAAHILYELKMRGEVIPLPDALIAAHSLQGSHSVYTTDGHFERVKGLELYEVRP